MKYSVIIPAYNEEQTILELINKVKTLKRKFNIELIVVDDGSTDKTSAIFKNVKGIKKIILQKNCGKGFAIREGIKSARGDYVIIQDADLEYDPLELPKMLSLIENGKCEVVFGSRFLGKISGKRLLLHDLGNKILSYAFSLSFGKKITDMETCYKIIPREFFEQNTFESARFDIEVEMAVKVAKSGYRIIEVPIKYNARTHAQGKKINFIDGIVALAKIIKYKILG